MTTRVRLLNRRNEVVCEGYARNVTFGDARVEIDVPITELRHIAYRLVTTAQIVKGGVVTASFPLFRHFIAREGDTYHLQIDFQEAFV
jgi:hypothetical protein